MIKVAAGTHPQDLALQADGPLTMVPPDPGVLHSDSLAKYAVAFLRNTHRLRLLQGESEFRRPSMQLLDNALPVLLLVVGSSRVLIIHPEAHGVIEQHGDLARGRRHGFGLPDTRGQATIESA